MKISLLVFFTLFLAIANGAEASRSVDLESAIPAVNTPLLRAQMSAGLAQRAHNLLEADYEKNLGDLIQTRWFFRKTANCTEALGNTLLYIGSGTASVAAGIKLIGSSELSDIFLFASTACFAAHITFIGVAKCSSREEAEREGLLETLADEVGFKVIPLKTNITDDGGQSTEH
jgi:hypothetical protein